jgi:fatty-acyl-CoA synthase
MRASVAKGPISAPLINQTVIRCFDEATERWTDRDAIIARHQSLRWTYGDLRERVNLAALGLLDLALRPGERIGICAPNIAEWAVIQYAAAKTGLIVVGINPTLAINELVYVINRVECAALVIAASPLAMRFLAESYRSAPSDVPTLRLIIGIGKMDAPGIIDFDELLIQGARQNVARLSAVIERIDPGAPAIIQFTSGTTAPAKPAALSHYSVTNAAHFGAERLAITETDRICVPVPLFHSFGIVGGNLLALTRGAAVIYPSARFNPGATLSAVAEERCTALYGVPAMFAAALRHPEFATFDLRSLRTGIMAGAPCPESLMRRVIGEMHLPDLVTAFGMTETSAAGLATARDDAIERRARTLGQVTAHTEIKIIDERGLVVPRGVVGEFCVRGFAVMLGYWRDRQATAQVIDPDGWMHTGDLVALDEEGYGTLFGRVADLVNSGGEKILPGEVEAFLGTHPAIEVAHVFGIPDARRGEVLCAWIKPRPGQQLTPGAVRAYCHGQIANHKIPRRIVFVDAFPTTATGKVQKFVMRERMRETGGDRI